MIYSSDINIPILSPIQFQGATSTKIYPLQEKYIGKISSETEFTVLITEEQYNSVDEFVLKVVNHNGVSRANYEMQKMTLSTGFYYAKCAIDAPAFPVADVIQFGLFFGTTLMADSVWYEANPRAEKHYRTIRYTNSVNDWGTIFGDFAILVEAGFNPNDMAFKGVKEDFQDQNAVNTMVYSQPYYTETLSIGGTIGIPNWLAAKLNAIFMCDSILLNGRLYEPAKGASLEKIDQTYDGLARYKIELQRRSAYSQDRLTEAESNYEFTTEFSSQFD